MKIQTVSLEMDVLLNVRLRLDITVLRIILLFVQLYVLMA